MKDKDQKQEKPQEQPPPPDPKESKEHHHEDHHHGKDMAKRFGHAVTFGAGATVGSDAVNAIIRNL